MAALEENKGGKKKKKKLLCLLSCKSSVCLAIWLFVLIQITKPSFRLFSESSLLVSLHSKLLGVFRF